MNSISEACNELKRSYDTCFNVWFSEKFLKGDHNHAVCDHLFDQYKECLKKAIKEQKMDIKEVEKEILGTDEEVKFNSS